MMTNQFHVRQSHSFLPEKHRAARFGRVLSGIVALVVCCSIYAVFAMCLLWFATSSFHALQTNGREQIRLCERFNFATCSRFSVKP